MNPLVATACREDRRRPARSDATLLPTVTPPVPAMIDLMSATWRHPSHRDTAMSPT
ncbi:hypothetical protein AB0L22_17360 [Micromonospora haikouensis]|uniref:hypothetical protein n=1 Tax=Micromonospora haikouensis TaxID=686309 RepID=UPI00343CB3D2